VTCVEQALIAKSMRVVGGLEQCAWFVPSAMDGLSAVDWQVLANSVATSVRQHGICRSSVFEGPCSVLGDRPVPMCLLQLIMSQFRTLLGNHKHPRGTFRSLYGRVAASALEETDAQMMSVLRRAFGTVCISVVLACSTIVQQSWRCVQERERALPQSAAAHVVTECKAATLTLHSDEFGALFALASVGLVSDLSVSCLHAPS